MNDFDDFSFEEETSFLQYQSLLNDSLTKLPTALGIIKKIRSMSLDSNIILLNVNIADFNIFEDKLGWEECDNIIKILSGILIDIKLNKFGKDTILFIENIKSSSFYFAIPYHSNSLLKDNKLKIKDKVKKLLIEQLLAAEKYNYIISHIHIGIIFFAFDPKSRFERLFYRNLFKAKIGDTLETDHDNNGLFGDIKDIIKKKHIKTHFQPIYDIQNDRIFGYEALTRGPKGSYFYSAETLFEYAIKFGIIEKLDELCYKNAILNSVNLSDDMRVFLNLELITVLKKKNLEEKLIQALKDAEKKYDNFILEITERSVVSNFEKLRESINYLREYGFKIAIDDAGVGYASLGMISELSPDFIKLDISLIKDINKSIIKQNLITAFYNFAIKQNITLVAEGIENEKDLSTIKNIGIRLGQGFFLGRPKEVGKGIRE